MCVAWCLRRDRAWLGTVPDEGGVLRADEHEQTHAHQLLRGQQDVLVVPGDVLLQLSSPQLLVGGAERQFGKRRAEAGQGHGEDERGCFRICVFLRCFLVRESVFLSCTASLCLS